MKESTPKVLSWEDCSTGYVPKILRTQSGQFQHFTSGLCPTKSAVCNTIDLKLLDNVFTEHWCQVLKMNGKFLTTKDPVNVHPVQPAWPHSMQCPCQKMCSSRGHLAVSTKWFSSQTNENCLCKTSFTMGLCAYGSLYDYIILITLIAIQLLN